MVFISERLNHARTARLPATSPAEFVPMKIVVDQNIRGAGDTFGQHGNLHFMDGREIFRAQVLDADVLIIRTATRVDEQLLRDSRVGFVGTTSIGTDHLDTAWLDQNGICWASAPGCNADSAAQYTLAMIWLANLRTGGQLKRQRAAIIGRGNVGSRVQRLLEALGVEVVANDPPLADGGEPGLVNLEEALQRDIICFHVPLTTDGPYPTFRFIDAAQLALMPKGALLVNTARGDVICGPALLAELQDRRLHAALDVWPGEPRIDHRLLEASTVATPHVAGYSDDGKRKGTWIVYEAFCRWAGLEPVPARPDCGERPKLTIEPGEDGLSKALDAACFVRSHDEAMRRLSGLTEQDRAAGFDRLRRDYPTRRDFQAWSLHCPDPEQAQLFDRLGFSVNAPY